MEKKEPFPRLLLSRKFDPIPPPLKFFCFPSSRLLLRSALLSRAHRSLLDIRSASANGGTPSVKWNRRERERERDAQNMSKWKRGDARRRRLLEGDQGEIFSLTTCLAPFALLSSFARPFGPPICLAGEQPEPNSSQRGRKLAAKQIAWRFLQRPLCFIKKNRSLPPFFSPLTRFLASQNGRRLPCKMRR